MLSQVKEAIRFISLKEGTTVISMSDTHSSALLVPTPAFEAAPFSIPYLLMKAFEQGASDVHLNPGTAPIMRLGGKLVSLADRELTPEDTVKIAKDLLTKERYNKLAETGEVDFAYALPGVGRCRVNIFKQRRQLNMAFRILATVVPTLQMLRLPRLVEDLALKRQGLILVTGPTGSGKSTTLAAIIDHINRTQSKHIITLEDPIEYLHYSKKSLVAQREVGTDTTSFQGGLRAALRQDPDVILVGEMRDLETISTAITAAETGHLVLATLHTPDAPQTIDRIIDVFPTDQQRQVRIQLASVLIGVLSQRLIPKLDESGRAMALEILINTPAVANLMRQEKIYQLKSLIQTSRHLGMQTMMASIQQLVADGVIHKDALKEYELGMGEGNV